MPQIDFMCPACMATKTVNVPFAELVPKTVACSCGTPAYRVWSSPNVAIKAGEEKIALPELPLPEAK